MPTLPDLATCKKIGFIVPSSNTALEPITNAIFTSVNASISTAGTSRQIICLFTRIQVKTVGTDCQSTSQFSNETLVYAARLLADADVDAIVWNGTSGMWVGTGLAEDRELAKAMAKATGVPCSTTTVATIEVLEALGVKEIAIAVPYDAALTARVEEFFTNVGYNVVSTARMQRSPTSNLEIAKSEIDEIRNVIINSVSQKRDVGAVIVACTNWPASGLVEELESDLDAPIVDSIIISTWWALRMIGHQGSVSGWGRLLRDLLSSE